MSLRSASDRRESSEWPLLADRTDWLAVGVVLLLLLAGAALMSAGLLN